MYGKPGEKPSMKTTCADPTWACDDLVRRPCRRPARPRRGRGRARRRSRPGPDHRRALVRLGARGDPLRLEQPPLMHVQPRTAGTATASAREAFRPVVDRDGAERRHDVHHPGGGRASSRFASGARLAIDGRIHALLELDHQAAVAQRHDPPSIVPAPAVVPPASCAVTPPPGRRRGSRPTGAATARIHAVVLEQLRMGALLDDPALVDDDQPVEPRDRASRCAMAITVLPRISVSSCSWIAASISESSADVASSRTRIGASLSITRASATRWRCPPESLTPRSPAWAS